MRTGRKIVIGISLILVFMLAAPILTVNFAPADDGMGLCFILFFVIDPLTVIALSLMAETDFKRLWWLPLSAALAFPLFFSLAVWGLVFELFIYSAVYLIIGAAAACLWHFAVALARKRRI